MDYFRLNEDTSLRRRWHIAEIGRGGEEVEDLYQFRPASTEAVELEVQVPGPAPDFVINYIGVPVVSRALGEAIEGLAPRDVQRIPARAGKVRTHEVLHVTRRIYCLDEARSSFELAEGTSPGSATPDYHWIVRVRLDTTRIPEGTHIFRLGGYPVDLMVSSELKRMVEKRGFSGMSFEPAFEAPEAGAGRKPVPAPDAVVPPALQKALRGVAGAFGDEFMTAIIGFEAGGPVSVVAAPGEPPWATYLTTELARSELVQRRRGGGYELLVSADDAGLAQEFLTEVARVGTGHVLGDGALLGLTPEEGWGALRGAVLEEVARAKVEGRTVRVLRCHGLLASELRWAGEHGGPAILKRLRKAKAPGLSKRRRAAAVP